jgi:exoribonuclease-2
LHPTAPIDQVARHRLSTVYMPGHKVTMLPDAVVQTYTLARGARLPCPVAVRDDGRGDPDLHRYQHHSRVERVPIVANLRHDQLDDVLTDAFFDSTDPVPDTTEGTHVALTWSQ